MKIGDLIRIKHPIEREGAYLNHLLDEVMLVTDIIDKLVLPDNIGIAIDGLVECISETGVHRFPMEDMEVVQ